MKYDEQKTTESESGGHLGAVAGLIIGIILGSLMLNAPASGQDTRPAAQDETIGSYLTIAHG
jgi:gas vesicle protein